GEQDSLSVNVNCNNCPITRCSITAGCTKCRGCGGTCGANTNNYGGQNVCLNPDQQCTYSCLEGSCGAVNCALQTNQCPRGDCGAASSLSTSSDGVQQSSSSAFQCAISGNCGTTTTTYSP
ncbi:hypothetical protein J4447_05160, partial [Candidatus Pacearchaeota archaeon]|nr:hypothetical protein [Candidatus Pacearchaeota archaeon]